MKIIVTVSTYYPRKDGVQNVTEYLINGLLKKGNDIVVITPNVENSPSYEVYNGVEIYRVNVKTKFGLYFGDKKKYQELVLSLASKADCLYNVCTQTAMTDWVYPLLKKMNCLKVLHLHGIFDFKWHKKDFQNIKYVFYKLWCSFRWRIYYTFRNFKKYDKIIQLHEKDSGYIYFKKKHIDSYVLENAGDQRFIFKNDVNKENYAICVANYMERKNQEFVLDAFYKANIDREFKLIFIGSTQNEYYNFLVKRKEQLDKKYGFRNVQLLYGVSREDTILYVKKASLYLLGSIWEAFPISIIEALGAKVPFISTDTGITKYLPGGITVRNRNEMSKNIETLLTDRELYNKYAEEGLNYFLEKLTVDKKVDELERILKDE